MNFHYKHTRGFTPENLAFYWLTTTEIILNFKSSSFPTKCNFHYEDFAHASIRRDSRSIKQGCGQQSISQIWKHNHLTNNIAKVAKILRGTFYFVQALKIIVLSIFFRLRPFFLFQHSSCFIFSIGIRP